MIGALMMRLSIRRKLPLRKDSLGERVVMELCLGDGSFGLNSLCTATFHFRPILILCRIHQESCGLFGKAGFFAAWSGQFLDTSDITASP